ncbi:deleted in malignant brain tumors 1 protein-like [Haliotis rubra]|uniref:deleted in malignant brain tumors 1 protein-like n=1 Tax=Haliotis rubra TaxID=36100 RepID=UPI001EE59B98|nr:deleted in malignant brain tumors 1 protein-like [Haliotis rubra]
MPEKKRIGSTVNDPLLKIKCYRTSETIDSTGPSITLKFSTDDRYVREGFQLEYYSFTELEPNACNGTVTASSREKYLTTPGYPGVYSNNIDCAWTIRGVYGTRITVKVVDADIESSPGCKNDYVQVIDVADGSKELGRFCGTDKNTYVSSGLDVEIAIHSDGNTRGRGFKIMYTVGDQRTAAAPTTPRSDGATIHLASGLLIVVFALILMSRKTLTLDSGCYCYLVCDWIISAQNSDQTIFIELVTFSVTSKYCGNDTISFYNGQVATETMCNLLLTPGDGYASYILSPGYPDDYYNNLNCAWTLRTASMRHIALDIIYNTFDESTDCASDFVQVYDINNANEPLGPLCGVHKGTLITRGSIMRVVFKTNGVGSGSGFRLKYRMVDYDDSHFNAQAPTATALTATSTPQNLTSPGYPVKYYK